jgi:hypothetical protein
MTRDCDHRTALITGLRDLAGFLETNTDLPIPTSVTVHHFPRDASDDDMCAQVDQIAARIGAPVDSDESLHGHYGTSINFGPVEYRAVAILADARARNQAAASYYGCVRPE